MGRERIATSELPVPSSVAVVARIMNKQNAILSNWEGKVGFSEGRKGVTGGSEERA